MASCMNRTQSLLPALLLMLAVSGCGGASGDGFTGERGDVAGTITLDDQPLPKGCQVIFMAEKGGYTATGVVEDGGKYKLVYGGGKGLPVGEYQIQLTAPVVTEEAAAPVDPIAMAGKAKLTRKSAKSLESSGPFPSKYASTTSSGLKHTVKPSANTVDLKLSSKDA